MNKMPKVIGRALYLAPRKMFMLKRTGLLFLIGQILFLLPLAGQELPPVGYPVPGLKKRSFRQSQRAFVPHFSLYRFIRAQDYMKESRFQLLPMPTGKNYVQQLGFFCRKELELDKRIALPIRFRLGSKEYVDRMEGK